LALSIYVLRESHVWVQLKASPCLQQSVGLVVPMYFMCLCVYVYNLVCVCVSLGRVLSFATC